ncbi:MAG: DUF3592 domain-containing protein [Phycisphaerae bacterium]|nr:DUF3592 domain-containing protein [Phycisphaerae bacterium]
MPPTSNEKPEETQRFTDVRKRLELAATWGRRIGIIFTVIGIGMQVGAGIAAVRTWNWRSHSKEATGIVMDLDARRSSGSGSRRGSTTYAEHVQFATPDGTTVEFYSSVSTSSPFQPGTKVPVRYNPDNPSDADIDTVLRAWFVPGIIGIMGIVFTFIGGGIWLQRGKR